MKGKDEIYMSQKTFYVLLGLILFIAVSAIGYAVSAVDWTESVVPSPGHNADGVLVVYDENPITLQEYIQEMESKVARFQALVENVLEEMPSGLDSKRIVTCSASRISDYEASCSASCNADEVVSGGGCEASNDHWGVRKSVQSGNAWNCVIHENYGKEQKGETAGTGYAVCVPRGTTVEVELDLEDDM